MLPKYKSVPDVEKCVTILGLIAQAEKPLGISDLAKQSGFTTGTVFNMVYTLVNLKVMDDLGDGTFSFGPLFYAFSNTYSRRSPLMRVVHPYLDQINQATSLVAFLGIRSELNTLLIDKADSTYVINISSEIGMQMPALAGAGIKAMLSLLSQEEVDELIGGTWFKKYTPNSIVDKNTYLEEINKVRREGIAFDREEYIEGIAAAAVPIKTPNRPFQAAIWVVGLKQQLEADTLLKLENLLKDFARKINMRFE